jgi:hypothetical protein
MRLGYLLGSSPCMGIQARADRQHTRMQQQTESLLDRQIPYGSPNPHADHSRRDGQVVPIACRAGATS